MRLPELIQRVTGRANPRTRARLVAAPTLGSAMRVRHGPFWFQAYLGVGTAYTVEACTDLEHWETVFEGIASAAEVEYVDRQAFKVSHRFYRMIAEGVRSSNEIGYATVTLPPGFAMIANPLEGAINTVGELFKGWPDGTTLSQFDTRLSCLTENAVKLGHWTNPAQELLPGEGAIFFNPTSDYRSSIFAGQVMRGKLSRPLPAGFSIRSSVLPKPGNLEELGFLPADGDAIHLFDRDRQKYVVHPYEDGRWTAGPPLVGVGEAFWVAKAKAGELKSRPGIGVNHSTSFSRMA
jgi:hypothetical protein